MKSEELKKQEVVENQEEILNPQEAAVVEGGNESSEDATSEEKLDFSELQNVEGGDKADIKDMDNVSGLGAWGSHCSC